MKTRPDKKLLAFAVFFFLLGTPLIAGWWGGAFVIFWTVPGAALVQTIGLALGCLWGAWAIGEGKIIL
jgi:hypothetical protein